MSLTQSFLKGTIHGKTIELEIAPGLPEGQQVSVLVQPVDESSRLPPGEGIRQSAGGWADAGDELDSWLEEMQKSRQQDRPELQ
jgi:hypothetical protein